MRRLAAAAVVLLVPACASVAPPAATASLQQQVTETERAFARTMAARDHAAFASFLADEAVFFDGDRPLPGKQVVAALLRG